MVGWFGGGEEIFGEVGGMEGGFLGAVMGAGFGLGGWIGWLLEGWCDITCGDMVAEALCFYFCFG